MRLVTWNCNQAFRRKQDSLLNLAPDIAVVPECEDPAEKRDWDAFTDWRWIGDNPNKGLAVFTRDGITITDTRELVGADHFLYIETDALDVLAVWAMNEKEPPRQRYIGQVYTALETHPELINGDTVVIGDFNWNRIWDESPKSPLAGDFADTRAILNEAGLYSAYHELMEEEFGEETAPTFYMHKQESRPYHIDYVFAPEEFLTSHAAVTVGAYADWIDASDHMPVMAEIAG